MGAQIFTFIFRTMRQVANDPNNSSYFLPRVLGGITDGHGAPLLPLHEAGWDLGQVTGEGGATFRDTIKSQWWTVTGATWRQARDPRFAQLRDHQAIACPEAPWPSLSLQDVTVAGLDNVYVLDNPTTEEPATGYQSTVTLQFGHYGGTTGLAPVSVTAGYRLRQCVCSAAAAGGTTCDGFAPQSSIDGGGHVTLTMTDLVIDARIAVTVLGSGPGRSLHIELLSLHARASGGGPPQLRVDELTIDTAYQGLTGLWTQAATNALTSADGRGAIAANLDATMNAPDFLAQLTSTLNDQFKELLDGNLGPVPAAGLPTAPATADNPVDAYLFDRVRVALNNPDSAYDLPKLVSGNVDPPLEPLALGTLDLGSQGMDGITFSDVVLHDVVATGLSNLQAPAEQLTTTGGALHALLVVGALVPPPVVTVQRGGQPVQVQVPGPPLTVRGGFSCTVQGFPTPLPGTFTIQAGGARLAVVAQISGGLIADLEVAFSEIELQVALDAIDVAVQIDSSFADIVNQVLGGAETKTKALAAINDQLQIRRADLSAQATTALRKQLSARLGG